MNRLKELRTNKNKTQQDIADFLQMSRRGYQKIEKGESQIKPDKAQTLANYFDVSVGYLLGYNNSDDIFWEALEKPGAHKQTEKEYLLELSRIESGRETFLNYFNEDTIKRLIDDEDKTLKLAREDAINQINHFFQALCYLSQKEGELLATFKTLNNRDKEIAFDLIKKLSNRND